MSLQERPMVGKGWIDRLVTALFSSLAIVLLWLLWRDHGRLSREVEELNRTVRQLARAPADAPDARRAIGLAREAIGKGQWDLGQIYLTNALTNSPRDIDCIREYASVILERDNVPIEAVERPSSMLQLAAYQVDAAQAQKDPAGLSARLGQLTREVEELNRTVRQLVRAPADARRAIGLAREAIGKGQWDLGQIYLTNALTNSPRDIDCIREYASVILERDNVPIEAVERLSSMLQLAAYQVDAAQVQEVSSLIERAEQVRKRLLGSQVASTGNADFNPRAEWDRLATAPPDLWKDPAGLSARLQDLEDFMSRLDEHAERSPELRAKAESEFRRWTEVNQAVRQCGYLDQCLKRLQDGEDLASQRAVAVVQAAENALPAFWGLDTGQFPAELRAKIDQYPQVIQDLVGRIGNARSGSVLDQIRQALAEKVVEESPWQEKCEQVERQIQRAQYLVVQLSSADAMKEAKGLIEERTKLLRKLRNKQFSAYQQWVIDRCDATFKAYMSYTFGLSEKDAQNEFRENKLDEIDQSLLSPEVTRTFNDILGKLMKEMGPKALMQTECEMSTAAKKRLEDF